MRITSTIIAALALAAAIPMRAAQTQDPAALQQKLNDAPGGDPALGKPIFEKVCATCHKFGDVGKEIGPDLSAVAGKLKRPEIVESILFPSRIIGDQYQPTLVQTKDGDVVSGLVIKENPRAITIVTSEHPEAPVEILKSKIAARQKSTTSAMPEHLVDSYSIDQIRGLIAFLLAGPK